MHQKTEWPVVKSDLYALLTQQIIALAEGCPPVSALSNAASLLWEALPDINWAGFYLLKDGTLYLGPFQGKTACVMIPVGRGVCGTAVAEGRLQLVTDVEKFPGHIACDSASRSEIVIPLVYEDRIVGVMDVDAPVLGRFDEEDAQGLSDFAQALMNQTDWRSGLL